MVAGTLSRMSNYIEGVLERFQPGTTFVGIGAATGFFGSTLFDGVVNPWWGAVRGGLEAVPFFFGVVVGWWGLRTGWLLELVGLLDRDDAWSWLRGGYDVGWWVGVLVGGLALLLAPFPQLEQDNNASPPSP
jgi:hypothetical protein